MNQNNLNRLSPVDAAALIDQSEEPLALFNSIDSSKAPVVFEFLQPRTQKEILSALPSSKVATILNALSPDDRTAFLESLPTDLVGHLLQYLVPAERALTIKLLGYPEDSVGRLMTPDYIAIKMDWTVKQVLDEIKARGRDTETINVIYAVDNQGVLLDDFPIRLFILSSPETPISALADHKFVALNVYDDEESAIKIFRKYYRVALPVVDSKGVLVGIVTIDDILKVATEQATEDFHRAGGVGALRESYLSIPFFTLVRKRAGWLMILFFGELLTASAMGFFQDEIARAVVLALFLPLIISSGGNAGSQASTLIIRALALGEVTFKDWWRIMRREVISGLILGAILGAIGFMRVSIWSLFSTIYGAHAIMIAFTIFFSLIGVVLWGTLAGSMLPLLLKKFGSDPAVSSAPFVATLVDVTGIVIYFTIAYSILQGTLL